MRVRNRRGCRTGIARAILMAVVLSGCAGSDALRGLTEEARLSRAQLTELARATDELRTELRAVRTRLEAVRAELERSGREGEARQRGALEAIDGLRARLGAAEGRAAETETLVAMVEARVTMAESRAAGTETRVESLSGAFRGVEATLGGLADHVARIETLATPPPAPDLKAARAAPRAPVASLTPERLFSRALESLRNGELGQAILDFEDFLAKHPSHAFAGNAQFWIAEAYFTARDYEHAAVEYRKVVDVAPKGEKTSEALLKLGLAYRSLKRPDRSREAWAQLLREFPESDAAQKARSALRDGAVPAKP